MSRRNPRDRRVKMLKLWLRGLRKMSRQIEDAKKREKRIGPRILAIDWLDRERVNLGMSPWQFERYAAGVRNGTIL